MFIHLFILSFNTGLLNNCGESRVMLSAKATRMRQISKPRDPTYRIGAF